MGIQKKTRIIILGAGFGGLYTALNLEHSLARDPNVEITLVNRENFIVFTPMLHEVAASDLDITHAVTPIRKLLRRVSFFNGDVEAIDLQNRKVVVSHGQEHHHHDLEFDHLVIGLGSITNFYNLPGLEQHGMTMKTLGDAIHLRNHMISNLEEADFECCPYVREPLLNFVIAGGGFAGVETIAGLNDFLRDAIKFYPHLREEMLRVILVHSGDVILPELGEQLGTYAQKKLAERKVEIHLKARVAEVTDREVILNNGTRIVTNTVVWTAGTSPNPLLETLPCKKDRGRIATNEYLEVPGWPGVWAVGDAASIPDPSGKPYPPTAQHAIRQGKVLADNIIASLRGGKKKPFLFKTLGLLSALGKRSGVANILGFQFSGFVAWFLWRSIYLSKLPGFDKKIRVMIDWTLDLIFSKDLVQFMTLRAPSVSHAENGNGHHHQHQHPAPAPPVQVSTPHSTMSHV
ncbi:MAG TPA: NAD(P)/FAD-dependent oxidoreductase [Acidobacteriota bacterium]|nr:NAD(P)/FAD-dependent oxidoreductase [Acidobacteriota bacterium]HNG94125.1 NAD(P)/FAD-dependent oxidoreductase [Acidobacteriota bacterium]